MPRLKIGLIGDNIAASRAHELHGNAGRLTGVEVQYDKLVPRELGLDVVCEESRGVLVELHDLLSAFLVHRVPYVPRKSPRHPRLGTV